MTLEDALADILLRSVFEQLFQTIKAKIQELLSILLYAYVCRITVVLLESEAELARVILLSVGHLQEREHLEPLVK